jgi:hypothetical protein
VAGRGWCANEAASGFTGPGETHAASSFGTLALRVQPGDATVFVDGKEWSRP